MLTSVWATNSTRTEKIGWTEDVLLKDGTVITVKVQHSYEIRGRLSLLRDTELTFDTGRSGGVVVTQLFRGYHPLMLDRDQGKWYVVIYGGEYGRTKLEPGQDWGPHRFDCPPVAVLHGRNFAPIPLNDFPPGFRESNMLILAGTFDEHRKLNGKHLSLEFKSGWKKKYVPGYGHGKLCKAPTRKIHPTSAATKPSD
jgi:hypothetical protein